MSLIFFSSELTFVPNIDCDSIIWRGSTTRLNRYRIWKWVTRSIDSHNFKGWEVSHRAVCKEVSMVPIRRPSPRPSLQNQRNWSSLRVKPEDAETQLGPRRRIPESLAFCPRGGQNSSVPGLGKRNSPSVQFVFSGPLTDWTEPAHREGRSSHSD